MISTQPRFSDLHFSDADIDSVELRDSGVIVLVVRNVFIVTEAAALGREVPAHVLRCQITFDGVTMSRRVLREYDASGELSVRPPTLIEDVAEKAGGLATEVYELEGRLSSPPAWIEEWTVKARGWKFCCT